MSNKCELKLRILITKARKYEDTKNMIFFRAFNGSCFCDQFKPKVKVGCAEGVFFLEEIT